MKFYKGVIWFLFISASCFSQNLIVNPGFEEHNPSVKDSVRTTDYEINEAVGWSSPTEMPARLLDTTTSSYSKSRGGDPTRPHSGVSYIALSLYFMSNVRYYIGGEFSNPLEAGKKYKFSLHMALGLHSTYTVDELGVYFSKNKVTQNTKDVMTHIAPQLVINIKNAFKAKCQWVEISGYYTATGGEKYFIVGNFKKNPPKSVVDSLAHPTYHDPAAGLRAPYLIDDLSMSLSNDKEMQAIAPGKTLVKDNIHFKTADSTLTADSYAALDEIISEMKKQPNLKVEIDGHTDNIGNVASNQKLSEARARAVATYFKSKGIVANRIKTKGFGSSKPISTDQNKNRRVEFVFY